MWKDRGRDIIKRISKSCLKHFITPKLLILLSTWVVNCMSHIMSPDIQCHNQADFNFHSGKKKNKIHMSHSKLSSPLIYFSPPPTFNTLSPSFFFLMFTFLRCLFCGKSECRTLALGSLTSECAAPLSVTPGFQLKSFSSSTPFVHSPG